MPSMQKITEKYRSAWTTSHPKLGRWAWCKRCNKHTRPIIGPDFSLVVCGECGWGLAPAADVCRFGSFKAWHEHLETEFGRRTADPNN
jgi:hypothetical protein